MKEEDERINLRIISKVHLLSINFLIKKVIKREYLSKKKNKIVE